jgi:seryl-tRNA synthetase
MTDKDFAVIVKGWIEGQALLDEIYTTRQDIRRQKNQTRMPEVVKCLDEIEQVRHRLRELDETDQRLSRKEYEMQQSLYELRGIIQETLPINIWYQSNGTWIRWVREYDDTPTIRIETRRAR